MRQPPTKNQKNQVKDITWLPCLSNESNTVEIELREYWLSARVPESVCYRTPSVSLRVRSERRVSPHLASPRLASPGLAWPRLTSPRLTSPRLTSPRLASPRLASPRQSLPPRPSPPPPPRRARTRAPSLNLSSISAQSPPSPPTSNLPPSPRHLPPHSAPWPDLGPERESRYARVRVKLR
jgi:hypothetical protein